MRISFRLHMGRCPVGSSLPASALATTAFGTPSPFARRPSPVEAANTVVTTSPSRSTTGPPELPLRTSARNGVILRSHRARGRRSPRWSPRRCARAAPGVNVSGPFSG